MKKLIAAAFVCLLATTSVARADTAADLKAQMEALQKQMEASQKQILDMQAQLDKLQALKPQPQPGPARPAAQPVLLEPGNNAVFLIHGEPVQVYGVLDLSLDSTTKGLTGATGNDGSPAVGNMGWQSGISSQSYVGVRGARALGSKFMPQYQLETQIDVATTSSVGDSNSAQSNVVKGALTSRNSYIGIGNKYSGSLRIGKSDAPYKNSTAALNPFSQMLGDYSVVMGNTGGDNRVEFGTRLNHSIWWDSPNWGGFTVSLLTSPGQNRSSDNSITDSGDSDCAGGNIPGSGALQPYCNDGSFGTAYSAALMYRQKKFYGTVAYELHKAVNRTSDVQGNPLQNLDIADEDATKVGAQWTFIPGTTFNAVYENMRRLVPAALAYQNERTRDGWWLAATTNVSKTGDNLAFGWARANPSPGDPGQHNTPGGANPDNMANMLTLALRHPVDRHLSFYVDYAQTMNHKDAHYDLGAGGRGLTTDCHDGSVQAGFDPTVTDASGNPIGGVYGSGPHCFAGGLLRGISAGMRLQF
ncbi:MAG TPA: porin [Candidatus Elarobacter sp.]|jgi:predicted porin|nr:porin [Candidatus Elarobacter sp.]